MMGDPARANMMLALMSGMALTGVELAREAGITASTASSHLSKLEAAGLVVGRRQGRCVYFQFSNEDVPHAIEAMVSIASRAGHLRTRPGPRDAALREARTCYDHLAGRHAVMLYHRWTTEGVLRETDDGPEVTEIGAERLASMGIDLNRLRARRRPVCRTCVDWSERQSHLGGGLGAAMLSSAIEHGWIARREKSREALFSETGLEDFTQWTNGIGA